MPQARTIIVAISPERAIGLFGQIPWRHPGDLQRFKRLTMGGTVIMGRNTFESIGGKPLPGRQNIVLTSRPLSAPGVEVVADLATALGASRGAVWFIGGARVYREAMEHADRIDVTYVPDHVDHPEAVRFPRIDEAIFAPEPRVPHEDAPGLERQLFIRRPGAARPG